MFRTTLVFIFATLPSLMASADPQALIGKWAGACQNFDSNYVVPIMEFMPEGHVNNSTEFYADAQCSGNPFATEKNGPATYSATDKELVLTIGSSHVVLELTANYEIAGDLMTLTPTALTVNGETRPTPAASQTRRIP